MDMEISVPGSGFGEDGMSVASVEVVAGAKVFISFFIITDQFLEKGLYTIYFLSIP